MKKEVLIHFLFLIALFALVTLVKDWFDLIYLPFWFGGILGTILPDVDHLIYVYMLAPKEQTSQDVAGLISKSDWKASLTLLASTRSERTNLIFHTAHFQILFLAFALLVITSSGSLLGRGLVLAFLLHLLIDEVVDFIETGNLSNWFNKIQVSLDKEQMQWYLIANIVVLLIFGFLL